MDSKAWKWIIIFVNLPIWLSHKLVTYLCDILVSSAIHEIHQLTCSWLSYAFHFFFEVITDSILAIRASISPIKPFPDALRMKSMKARQDHIKLVYLISTHANCARLVFFWKVLLVSLSKFRSREHVNKFLWHVLYHIFIKVN